jgi:hypothetical protein
MSIGPPGVEVVTAFEPVSRLTYSATDESLRGLCSGHSAELALTPSAAGGTLLRWTVWAEPAPSWWRRTLAHLLFRLACGAGLRNLRKLFQR